MPRAPQNAAADVARIVAGDIAGGVAALHLVAAAAARSIPGDQAEALIFLARRLAEMVDELRIELAHMDAPRTKRRCKRVVA